MVTMTVKNISMGVMLVGVGIGLFVFGVYNLFSKQDSIDSKDNMAKFGLSNYDPSSFSNPEEAVVEHLHLDLDVDFVQHVLAGEVKLKIAKKKLDAKTIALDVNGLVIGSVKDNESGQDLTFTISNPVDNFGSKMEIVLPQEKSKFGITIKYKTSPNASALQWLAAEQTAGGKHPYLFSQCQAIHCRSIIPCQDTPSVKMPYTASISAPSELVVLMSALRTSTSDASNGRKIYHFEQKVPMPSYLIALAVGDLHSRKIGPRSHVWSEKEFVDQAAYEFAETEQMLKTAEDICGEYVWGIYDLLILPPSFPFGGMENPCLTFVTPTILAGDRSLASVVAHEITHSWTGNLVTNRNFEHFWLNEGFTMFVERKINGRMFGEPMRQFSALNGLKDLNYTVNTMGTTNPLTRLVVDLKGGIGPDDAFSSCPYEKGHTFLFYLEQLVGGPEVFEPFLKKYLNHFKYQSIDTDDFKKYFIDYFQNNAAVKNIEWDSWLFTPGMPHIIPKYDTSLAEACTNLGNKWINWTGSEPSLFSADDLTSLQPLQVQDFLALLLEKDDFPLSKVKQMQAVYNLDSNNNSEIKFRWLRLCLKARWVDKVDVALQFATEQGRMKFVSPIFRDLYSWEEMRQRAIDSYEKHKDSMMFVTAYNVAKDLHLK